MVMSFMEHPECENFRLKVRTNQLKLSVRYCFFARKFLFRSKELRFQFSEKEEKRYKNSRSFYGKAQIDQKNCTFFQVQGKQVKNTGKSLSEGLIFASTNPQYDNRLFIAHENCKHRIPAEHVL